MKFSISIEKISIPEGDLEFFNLWAPRDSSRETSLRLFGDLFGTCWGFGVLGSVDGGREPKLSKLEGYEVVNPSF